MKHAINLAEVRQPKSKRRAEAKAVATPPIEARLRPDWLREEAKCPGCGAWRPDHCISLTPSGWLGDCCITALARTFT